MTRLVCAAVLFLTAVGSGFLSAQDLIPVKNAKNKTGSVATSVDVQAVTGDKPMREDIIRLEEIIEPSAFPPEIITQLKNRDLDRNERIKAEWEFLKANAEEADDAKTVSEILEQLEMFLHSNPESEFAVDGQELRSRLHSRLKDYKAAVVDLLKLVYEYPESKLSFQAKRSLTDMINKKMKRKHKPILTKIAAGPDAVPGMNNVPERLADFLTKLTRQAGEFCYEPVLREYKDFFYRYPDYKNSDELQMLLGELHLKTGKYTASMLSFRKLLALYPASLHRARVQRLIGDIFGDSLRDNDKAASAYRKVIDEYPLSDEVPVAYIRLARLEERQKHYRLAIDIYEKVIKLYPGKDAALNAFNAKAKILNKKMKRPDDAIKVYGLLADMFNGTPAAASALETAAKMASKLKEYAWAAEIYARLAQECPESPKAPFALYSAARIYEKELENLDKAVEVYNRLAVKYPDHKLGKKAKSRARSITKK